MNTYTIKTELSLEDAKKVILLGGLSLIPDEAKQAEAMADSMSSADTKAPTLRDQFAMAAMQGIIAHFGFEFEERNADQSYLVADAMMEARKGKAQS